MNTPSSDQRFAISAFARVAKSEAFTLIELLVVISIIGILTAISLPAIRMFKPDPLASGSRQLMDDLNLARRRAIADHTTVYVLFMPPVPNLPNNLPAAAGLSATETARLAKGQYVSYALYEKRQIGDQPGRPTEHYITDWRTLPAGVVIAPQKFGAGLPPAGRTQLPGPFNYYTFYYGTNGGIPEIQFLVNARGTNSYKAQFPYIAFDYKGTLASPWEQWRPPAPPAHDTATSGGFDTVIPLAQGRLNQRTNWTAATFTEDPVNGWTNLYNNVVIDGPTGRVHLDRRKI